MSAVGIIDYGLGNLRSIHNAVAAVGGKPTAVTRPEELARTERLILPGVGAFAAGMTNLEEANLVDSLKAAVKTGTPLLGICLGLQLLFDVGEEGGERLGLGLIPGRVKPLKPNPTARMPHVGWNRVRAHAASAFMGTLLENTDSEAMYYFVHSFACEPAETEHILCTSNYGGVRFVSGARCGNITGLQFHPEKSAEPGLGILENFVTRTW